MKIKIFILFASLSISGCTNLQVMGLDSKTGYFPTSITGEAEKAKVIKAEKYNLDEMSDFIVVSGGYFLEKQIRNIGYFGKIIDLNQLETEVIKAGIQDKVHNIRNKIGVSNAYKYYKPFLLIRYEPNLNEKYVRFIITEPGSFEDLFITESPWSDYAPSNNDQNTWYPMLNSMIDWIKENSQRY